MRPPRARAASPRAARRPHATTPPRARRARRPGRCGDTDPGRAGSPVAQHRPDVALDRPLNEQRAERHVARREATVPEEDPLVVALAPRLAADDDVAELRMQRL